MSFIKKNFFILFLAFYLIIGCFYSLEVGISHDEYHEQKNWKYNVTIVKNVLFKYETDITYVNYTDKFYGIGFQIISQPIQYFAKDLIVKYQNVSLYGANLLAKHFVIFVSFFISGIFFYLISLKIVGNKFFSGFSTTLYLLYPYLLGHALFNPKDIPFLCFWTACTYFSFVIFDKLTEDKYPNYWDIILLSFLSAFLLSIRITGILIFFQYLITFLIFLNFDKLNWKIFLRSIYKKFLIFIFSFALFVYILYPVFWKDPLLFFTAIEYMGKYYHDVCTLTLGKCMPAKNLDPIYIPIWLSVKLPLIILLGLILLPFVEKKIFINKKKIIFFGTVLGASFLIPLLLIFNRVHLYDEVRHIMFLFPLIFMLGTISFYFFSKKLFYILGFATLFLFVVENIKIFPYQYVWFNSPSRFLDLSKDFELDYWGLSGRELAKKIPILKKELNNQSCLLTSPLFSVKPFLESNIFKCFGPWGAIDSDISRPFWAIQHVKNLKKGRSYKCNSIYEEQFKLLFNKEKIITGKLIKCD